MNLGLLPTKGLTLPLLSYGRSSMLVTLAWVGMLLRVHHEVAPPARARSRPRGGRHEPHRHDHGGRHRRPRVPGARDRRARCAPRARSSGSAPSAASRRASCRRPAIRSSGSRSRACAARASAAGSRRRSGCCAPSRRRGARCKRRRPGVVLGLGGFASGPGGIAAWLAGAPLVIHEQNAVAGLTNRWLARFAARIAEGFPGSFPAAQRRDLRRQPRAAAKSPRCRRRASASSRATGRCGCSCSAAARAPRRSTGSCPRRSRCCRSRAGPGAAPDRARRTATRRRRRYRAAGIQAEVRAFVDDMAAAYANADLVCRARAP